MMKIVMRHYVRVRLLPMLSGIYDTQCAFKCFRASDLLPIINEVRSIGAALTTTRIHGEGSRQICS